MLLQLSSSNIRISTRRWIKSGKFPCCIQLTIFTLFPQFQLSVAGWSKKCITACQRGGWVWPLLDQSRESSPQDNPLPAASFQSPASAAWASLQASWGLLLALPLPKNVMPPVWGSALGSKRCILFFSLYTLHMLRAKFCHCASMCIK